MEQGKLSLEKVMQFEMPARNAGIPDVSIIIPVCERRDNLRDLYLQYIGKVALLGVSYEFIFVLDGPDKNALRELRELKHDFPEVQVIVLHRNIGEAEALAVGFSEARGEIIVTLSAYFQVEPDELHKLFKSLTDDKQDMVVSWRTPRIDSPFNQVQAKVFHWLVRTLTGTKFHDVSCGLRVMRRKVVQEIHLYGDQHRFFPLLAYQRGFSVTEVPVRQSSFDVGQRIYQPGIYLRRLLDIFTLFFLFKFTRKPLRFFGLIGSMLSGAGILITGYLGMSRILQWGPIAGRPLLIFGVLLIVLGIQLFSVGLLGEIIIFTHARKMEEYTVERILD